jgi:hypothetical protein
VARALLLQGRMTKRTLDTSVRQQKPGYPTYEEFDQSRRDALKHLGAIGAALFGAAALAGCGDRKVGGGPDSAVRPREDGSPLQPDQGKFPISGGKSWEPDARIELRPDQRHLPDARILQGDVAGPDARVDEPDPSPDPGYAPVPPARADARR